MNKRPAKEKEGTPEPFALQEVKQLKGGAWLFVRHHEGTELRMRTTRVPAHVSQAFYELMAELERLQGIRMGMPSVKLKGAADAFRKRWGFAVGFEMKLPRGFAQVRTEIMLSKCEEADMSTEQFRVYRLLRRLDDVVAKSLTTLTGTEPPKQLSLFTQTQAFSQPNIQ